MSSKITYLLVFLFSMTWAARSTAQNELPDVQVQSLLGERVSIADHGKNGKITVLNFWATWCSPCKKELDAISEVYEYWQADYDMELVAVSIDNARSSAKVAPMIASKGWDYVVYLDPQQQLQTSLNFQTVPQTYIIDKEGKIVYAHSGYVPGGEWEIEEKLKELSGK